MDIIAKIRELKDISTSWLEREIQDCDGLEIHPCRVEVMEDDTTLIEQCDVKDAEFWSVYGHSPKGGVIALADFTSRDVARAFASLLLEAWPHLEEFGLLE